MVTAATRPLTSVTNPGCAGGLVRDAMVRTPTTHPSGTTVAQASAALGDPHRHLLLIVSGRRLRGTLDVTDLQGDLAGSQSALSAARLTGRTVGPEESLAAVHTAMLETGQRRRAVVDDDGTLLGLLCLKASGTGFCSDEDIEARSQHG